VNYSSATLALEGWFAQQWGNRTLVSYESGNVPLPEGRPLPTEAWLRLTLSGIGFARRTIGRGEPWRIWSFLATHQVFVPPASGHDLSDGYISELVTVWDNLDFCIPTAGARWTALDPPLPPTSHREAEWYQQNLSVPLMLEWRG
jgi:hypothetical protein